MARRGKSGIGETVKTVGKVLAIKGMVAIPSGKALAQEAKGPDTRDSTKIVRTVDKTDVAKIAKKVKKAFDDGGAAPAAAPAPLPRRSPVRTRVARWPRCRNARDHRSRRRPWRGVGWSRAAL